MTKKMLIVCLLLSGFLVFGAGVVVAAPEKPMEIRWFVSGGGSGADFPDGNVLQKELEQKFNVKIINVCEDIYNNEKMNLLLSSGEAPDIAHFWGEPLLLYQQEITRTIPKEFIKKYAPGLAKIYDENPVGWLLHQILGKTDEYAALSAISVGNSMTCLYAWYRLDWLEAVGIKPKGKLVQCDDRLFFTSESFSLDEHERIMEAFTNKDPDRNGKNDTWGMSAQGGAGGSESWSWAPLYQSFQLPECNIAWGLVPMYENGKELFNITTEKYKAFLKYTNNLYKKGYIDPEWVVLDWTKEMEKLHAGMAGWGVLHGSAMNPAATGNPPYGVLDKNPQAKILVTPAVKGPDGLIHFTPYNDYGSDYVYWCFIGKQVDDEKLKKILQIYDYINYNPDVSVRIRYQFGEEGKHWKWEGEPFKSAIISLIPLEQIVKEKGKDGFGVYSQYGLQDKIMTPFYVNKAQQPVYEWGSTEGQKIKYQPRYRLDVFNETKFIDVNKQYGSEVTTIATTFFMKAIVGEVDIDKEWNNYIAQLNKAGLDKLLAEAKKAPLLDRLLKGEIKY